MLCLNTYSAQAESLVVDSRNAAFQQKLIDRRPEKSELLGNRPDVVVYLMSS